MRRNSKLNIFASGLCFGGSVFAFGNAILTANPENIILLVMWIIGFLLNLYLGVRDDLWAKRYSAKIRIWLKNIYKKKDF